MAVLYQKKGLNATVLQLKIHGIPKIERLKAMALPGAREINKQ